VVLPCEVRVSSATHLLAGAAGGRPVGFKRLGGVLLLVIELPDGSPGTIPAEATDVFGLRRHLARALSWMRRTAATQ
jgi:hypothetical protein